MILDQSVRRFGSWWRILVPFGWFWPSRPTMKSSGNIILTKDLKAGERQAPELLGSNQIDKPNEQTRVSNGFFWLFSAEVTQAVLDAWSILQDSFTRIVASWHSAWSAVSTLLRTPTNAKRMTLFGTRKGPRWGVQMKGDRINYLDCNVFPSATLIAPRSLNQSVISCLEQGTVCQTMWVSRMSYWARNIRMIYRRNQDLAAEVAEALQERSNLFGINDESDER